MLDRGSCFAPVVVAAEKKLLEVLGDLEVREPCLHGVRSLASPKQHSWLCMLVVHAPAGLRDKLQQSTLVGMSPAQIAAWQYWAAKPGSFSRL